jgi:hypothetical protein
MTNETEPAWPVGELDQILAGFRGANGKMFDLVDERGRALGNHGDTLLHHAFWTRLPELGITCGATSPDVLVVPPNGALLDSYGAPDLLARWLAGQPDVPVVVFPSSALFKSTDPSRMFGNRKSGGVWVLREERSLNHLRECWGGALAAKNIELALDHDMVVTGRRQVVDLLGGAGIGDNASTGPLLVARLGVEGADMRDGVDSRVSLKRRAAVAGYQRMRDGRAKRAVRRRVTRGTQAAANKAMVGALPGAAQEWLRGAATSGWFDISDPTLASFAEFKDGLIHASTVTTNRLHVALPAAALGIPTTLVESGYHKLRGVYERSLVDAENFEFIGAQGW